MSGKNDSYKINFKCHMCLINIYSTVSNKIKFIDQVEDQTYLGVGRYEIMSVLLSR